MFYCKITDISKGMLCGEFITTERSRPHNRPVNGKLRCFRDEKARLEFCNNKVIKSANEDCRNI